MHWKNYCVISSQITNANVISYTIIIVFTLYRVYWQSRELQSTVQSRQTMLKLLNLCYLLIILV